MSLFEEYLMRGYWLAESERLAIYKYLLKTKKKDYLRDSEILLKDRSLRTSIANGEICYVAIQNHVELRARKIGGGIWVYQIRDIKLSCFKSISKKRLCRFFAQAETDIIRNYPLFDSEPIEARGFTNNVYPYYSLNYYSDGKGKVKGLLEKMVSKDDPLLNRLLVS
jgi:hypothetical protein